MITRNNWCQKAFVKKNSVTGETMRCATEWLVRYGPANLEAARQKLLEVIGGKIIITWNDAPDRTYEQVVEAFKSADL